TKNITIRLWADVNTKLPVRIEADSIYNDLQVSMVQNNPEWNIELEPGFFEPKIPDNYVRLHERGLIGIDLENWPTLKVQPNMAAEKAGIKDGDVVLKIDGNNIEQIKSSEDAQKFLLGKSGEKVSFTVKRGEQIITFEVVREPLPK
ncbi:MAG: PDZ domain-containing protein, partial [Planctomycetota bacterium]